MHFSPPSGSNGECDTSTTVTECRSAFPMSGLDPKRFARSQGDGINLESVVGELTNLKKTHASDPDLGRNIYVFTNDLILHYNLYLNNRLINRDEARNIFGPIMRKSFHLSIVRLWKRRPWKKDIESCMPPPCLKNCTVSGKAKAD